MADKKLAYRRVIRDPQTNQLRVAFFDATTNQEITDLTGYEIVDGGAGTPITTPPTTTPNTNTGGSNNSNTNYDAAEPFDWAQWHATHSKGSGDILADIQKTLDTIKSGVQTVIKPVKDVIDAGKEFILPGSSGRVDKETGQTDIPPIGGANVPAYDPNSPGTKQLDDAMKGPYDPVPNVPTGEVARNVTYDPKNIGIREYPVDNTVLTDFAAALNASNPNVHAVINSAGQEPLYITDDFGRKVRNPDAKPGENRVGTKTVNHDITVNGDSYAFDAQFYLDGKQITPESDPAFFKELAKNSVVAGFTQIGMENNIVHLGKDYKDKKVRTWGYPGSLPQVIADGVKEGKLIKQQDEALGNQVYTKMVADVARPDPLAPMPAMRGAAFDPVVEKINKVRQMFDLAPIVNSVGSGINDLQKGITGAVGNAVTQIGDQVIPKVADNAGILSAASKNWNEGKNNLLLNPQGEAIKFMINSEKIPQQAFGGIASGMEAGANAFGGFMKGVDQFGKNVAGMIPDALTGLTSGFMAKPVSGPMATGANSINKATTASTPLDPRYANNPDVRDHIIKTVIGEAKGEDPEGWQAVAEVIRNRSLSSNPNWPDNPIDIVMQSSQFEPNANGLYKPTKKEMLELYDKVGRVVDAVMSGSVPDIVGGADHFYNPDLASPEWAPQLIAQGYTPQKIGGHLFLSPPKKVPQEGTGGPISKGFVTPPSAMPEQTRATGFNSVGGGVPSSPVFPGKEKDDLASIPKPATGFMSKVAEPNRVSAASSYNSDVVSATQKTRDLGSLPAGPNRDVTYRQNTAARTGEDSTYNAGDSVAHIAASKGSFATGGGVKSSFMTATPKVQPTVTKTSTPSPIVKAATTTKSTTAAATTAKSSAASFMSKVAEPNRINAASGYNSDVVSSTQKTSKGTGFMSTAASSTTKPMNKGML